jgi:predicted O-methyltransferase YrrM
MTEKVNYFDYYPKNIPTCEENLGENELKIISELNDIVNGPVEGNYCFIHNTQINKDSVPIKERSWKREFLRKSVKHSKYALEIGFNAGHSAAIMLSTNPNLTLVAIDISHYAYTEKCARHLKNIFKDRFGFFKGTSQQVLKNKKSSIDFDFIHVDGGHGIADFYFDIDWSEKNLKPGGKLLIDDAYLPDYMKYIAYKEQQEVFRTINPIDMKSSGENLLMERL